MSTPPLDPLAHSLPVWDDTQMTPPPLHGEEYRENACDFLAALLHEEAKPQQAEDAAWQDGSESPLDTKHSMNIHDLYTLW